MKTTRMRIVLAAVGAAVAASASLLGGVLTESSSPGRAAAATAAEISPDRALSGFSLGNTEALVDELQTKLRRAADDPRSLALLGIAYQQRARETGDPGFYPRAAGVLRRATALAPQSELATSGLASLALSQHRFGDGLALARRALRLGPAAARNYGLLGDALVELGRYEEAFRAFDRMAALKPNLASYARVSYARQLLGRQRSAIEAMRLAAASAIQPEPSAWTRVQLGKLHFERGELDAAERELRRALAVFPAYPGALEALARVEAARGRYGRAIRLAAQSAEAALLPEFITTLGDLYWAAGRKALAREQYALVAATERLLRGNGVRTDLESALFKVDHGIDLRRALAESRRAHRERPTIFAADTLSWALARNGRCAEALRYSKRALRLGTRDASFFFHRGMIERCLGHPADARRWFARALDQNPQFSLLWAPVARKALR
jgi:tetratricopeptide (TPR) repeat protein